MKGCFVVVHRSHEEGLTAYVYLNEEDARRSVVEGADSVMDMLRGSGYTPRYSQNGWDNIDVSVADENIYHEWSIIMSEIQ